MIYVGMYFCSGPKSVGGITWAKRAHAQSQYWAVKSDQKLKANRASLTEEPRKERLRVRREKETEDHKNQRLAILKRL